MMDAHGDDAGSADSESSGTTSGHGMSDSALRSTASSPRLDVVVIEDSPSEDGGDVAVDVKRECGSQGKGVFIGDGVIGKFNRGEIDGLFCPICYEAWASGGDHHICCLPCGHIYGLSCIKKWLGVQGPKKCPQCKKKCGIKDIRQLYATRVVAIDGELQKKVQSLEARCASLEKQSADWAKKKVEWTKREVGFHKHIEYLEVRTHDLEELVEDMENRVAELSESSLNCPGKLSAGVHSEPDLHVVEFNKFQMQEDFQIQGARLFGIDSSSRVLLFARRLSGLGGAHMLTKVSLFSNHEREDICLADVTKAVKDLQFSPHGGGLVLLASLGMKLSVLSTQSNNTVITYNLPAPAWSCSWDICDSHYSYAGLQNGTVLQFDMRQTAKHVESLTGLSDKLIHTLHSVSLDTSTGIRSVLTASALGLCQLNFGQHEYRSCQIPGSDKQGICISLAYSNSSDYILASYRPKIESIPHLGLSSPKLESTPGMGRGVAGVGEAAIGSHVLYRKDGTTYRKLGATCGNVSQIRLPKRSAIIDGLYENPVFASGDELTSELVLQELPSQTVIKRFKPKNRPIYDVKYSRVSSSGVLGCLTEDSFQLYSANQLCS